jgi:cysteinyl-tRNA synthetase
MAMRYLGDRFDIHTGGIDNVFPHHEDEIAQSAPLVGDAPARLWVHGEFLLMAGRKMAKSAGNFQRVTELMDRGLDPLAFRYLALTSRYGRKLNYSDTSLASAAAGLASLRARLRALGPPPADGPWVAPPVVAVSGEEADPATDRAHAPLAPLSADGRRRHEALVAALDDDLDLPTAIALVRETLRADLAADERRWLALDADAVLGLDLHRVWEADTPDADAAVPEEVATLVATRDAARTARDFTSADALRERIEALGWDVVDRPDGSDVQRR